MAPRAMASRRRALAAAVFASALASFLAVAGCGPPPAPARAGPIVLITADSLRADVVTGMGGEPELTPHLAALGREATWVGRAVAASSAGVPAMASLFTGLQPWQHQAILDSQARLAPDLPSLPQALKALGYQTFGFTSGDWYTAENGYARGFDSFEPVEKGWQAAETLSGLVGGRQFVWVHLPEPQAPYVRRTWLLPHLGGPAGASGPGGASGLPWLPRSIEPPQLEVYFDPAVPLPEEDRRLFWAMYRLNVAWADERIGRLLDALRASGQWDRTLLVVAANHGEEFREHGQMAHGGNLGREQLEVPLLVKLPAGWPHRLAPASGSRVAATRILATLVEAAGGTVPPAVAPSLFRGAPGGVLSELYATNGANQFSLLEGDAQLLWEARFAAAEPSYYRARVQLLGGDPEPRDPRLSEPPQAVLARLAAAFASTPPLAGREPPRLRLERWTARGSVPLADPGRAAALARRLAALWQRHAGEERTPAAEARLRLGP